MQGVKLIAFFKGTAGQFNNLTPGFACSLMATAANMRNTVSPLRALLCEHCHGKGYSLAANGPDDVQKDLCEQCNGTGRVVSTN